MTTTENKLGKSVDDLLSAFFGTFPGYDTVRAALLKGQFDDAVSAFKTTVKGPIDGLVAAVESGFPAIDSAKLQRAMGTGDYAAVVKMIGEAGKRIQEPAHSSILNPFTDNPLTVAQKMCGAQLRYVPPTGATIECVVLEVGAWHKVGGLDQTIPEAVPGTAGFWHSNAYGGYNVGIISAHEEGQTGVVAIYAIKPSTQGSLGKTVNSKGRIGANYGFVDSRVVGKSVLDPATPLQVIFPEGATNTTFEQSPPQRKPNNDTIFLGTYKIARQ